MEVWNNALKYTNHFKNHQQNQQIIDYARAYMIIGHGVPEKRNEDLISMRESRNLHVIALTLLANIIIEITLL